MRHLDIRRMPAPVSALSALFILAVSATLTLPSPLGHALPMAEDDNLFQLSSEIVVKSDDTFTAKLTMSESAPVPVLDRSACDQGEPDSDDSSGVKNVKSKFEDKDGTRTCTIEGTGSVTESAKNVRHSGDEFIVQTLNFDNLPSDVDTNITQSVTFPGEVTEADGGKVEGTKVSFNDNDTHEVRGKDQASASGTGSGSQDGAEDSSSIATWVWALVGVLAVAVAGGIIAVIVMSQRKSNQPSFSPYASPAQGYDPNQAFPFQPGQPYQPGYPDPAAQPYQPTYQPGYANPTAQPYQPGYTEPAPRPYQQTYNGQPVQPYQPPYNGQSGRPDQPGQPGQPY